MNGKEVRVSYFQVLSQHSPGGTEENYKKYSGYPIIQLRFEPSTSRIPLH